MNSPSQSQPISDGLRPTTESVEPSAAWSVHVVIEYQGYIPVLMFDTESKARAAYRKLNKAMADRLAFKNSAPATVEITDNFGKSSFDARALRIVRVFRLPAPPAEAADTSERSVPAREGQ